nr:hypothetical protein [Bacteroides intestinalis]
MDTEDLRLLNAFGEALGDLPSEEETRAAWNAFASRQDAQKRRRIIQMWTSGIAAAIVVLAALIVPRIISEDTIQDIEYLCGPGCSRSNHHLGKQWQNYSFNSPSHYHANHSRRWHTDYTQRQFPPRIS